MEPANGIWDKIVSSTQTVFQFSNETFLKIMEMRKTSPNEFYIAVVVGLLTLLGFYFIPSFVRRTRLRKLRVKKKEQCERSIAQLKHRLELNEELSTEQRKDIVNLSLTQLIAKLQSGELSALHALEAYQSKALEVHEKTNCLIEPIWEAETWALEADGLQGPKPPLHGVPVSVKDLFGIEGYDSTIGCAKYINQPMKEDAVLVKAIKAAGAIPFVKTGVPQSMISWENTNPIFGMTKNPLDLTRGPGGSSGGESALVAGGGSILGYGSDIGGSVRLPAACCGIYGFKPTGGRTSLVGMQFNNIGQQCVPIANGPLARDVESLVIGTKAMLSPAACELDLYTPPIPFRETEYNAFKGKKLKIGYFFDTEIFTPVPPMVRAVKDTVRALEKDGHEVELWKMTEDRHQLMLMYPKTLFADGGDTIRHMLQDDATDDAVGQLMLMLNLRKSVKKLISFLLKPFWETLSIILRELAGLDSVIEWWDHVEKIQDLRRKVVLDWEKNGFDAVIAPGSGTTPMPLYETKNVLGSVIYTSCINIFNFPAGSMPVTTVRKEDIDAPYPAKDLFHSAARKAMKGSEGLPMNIQVVTLPYQEEKCLRIMQIVDKAVKKYQGDVM